MKEEKSGGEPGASGMDLTVDEKDWCAEGQKRVFTGSDGLWVRFGFKESASFKSQCASFRFNPCVSAFAVIVLFGLVGFCSVPPGKFCQKQTEIYEFNILGKDFKFKKAEHQPKGDKNTRKIGAESTKVEWLTEGQNGWSNPGGVDFVKFYEKSQTIAIGVKGKTYNPHYRSQLLFEAKECFMPKLMFVEWQEWVTECFTWLYIITQDVWIVFLIWLCFSKYGKMKLGKDTDEPEFSYFSWFAMLFTCGVATGLFYYAVTEPQYYYLVAETQNDGYSERNRFTYAGVDKNGDGVFRTPTARVQDAMTTTWYHWGLHGWVCYVIVGLLLAFLHFRKGLPMTIKTCFYPLLGTRIYGLAGDLLDGVSVVATTMGVCTSLGMGVMQLNAGIELLNGGLHWVGKKYYNEYNYDEWKDRVSDLKVYWDSWSETDQLKYPWNTAGGDLNIATAGRVADLVAKGDQQMILIWCITAFATGSVMLGLKKGIKVLAVTCLLLGQFVIFYVWMMDDTWFLTNLFVQTLGDYIQKLPALGFYSSAVEQSEANHKLGEYPGWQYWWTIFYWGWWIAWAPFVGVFLARIGKGRTIREFITCSLFAACIYNFLFMNVLGGAGLKMQLLAEKYNIGTKAGGGCTETFHKSDKEPFEYYNTKNYVSNICRHTETGKFNNEKEYFCSTVTNLGCTMKTDKNKPLFDLMLQYADAGKFMCGLIIATLILYFIASSDSGSMVDDMVTANGLSEPCLSQRFFWAMTEGAAASALMSVGKYIGQEDGGLRALRSASICVGLPYTFIICFMCVALYRALQYEAGDRVWGTGFRTSILDVGVTTWQCGEGKERCFNGQRGRIDFGWVKKLGLYCVCPTIPLMATVDKLERRKSSKSSGGKAGGSKPGLGGKLGVVGASVLFYSWFILLFCDFVPVSDELQQWGSIQGDEKTKTGNKLWYLTNRYGYYHEWANGPKDRVDDVDRVRYNEEVEKKGHEKGISVKINEKTQEVGVGARWAKVRRVAAFGWFAFFTFTTYLTWLRSEVRPIYRIKGTLAEDFLAAQLWPMALYQMSDQLDQEPKVEEPPKEQCAPWSTI